MERVGKGVKLPGEQPVTSERTLASACVPGGNRTALKCVLAGHGFGMCFVGSGKAGTKSCRGAVEKGTGLETKDELAYRSAR